MSKKKSGIMESEDGAPVNKRQRALGVYWKTGSRMRLLHAMAETSINRGTGAITAGGAGQTQNALDFEGFYQSVAQKYNDPAYVPLHRYIGSFPSIFTLRDSSFTTSDALKSPQQCKSETESMADKLRQAYAMYNRGSGRTLLEGTNIKRAESAEEFLKWSGCNQNKGNTRPMDSVDAEGKPNGAKPNPEVFLLYLLVHRDAEQFPDLRDLLLNSFNADNIESTHNDAGGSQGEGGFDVETFSTPSSKRKAAADISMPALSSAGQPRSSSEVYRVADAMLQNTNAVNALVRCFLNGFSESDSQADLHMAQELHQYLDMLQKTSKLVAELRQTCSADDPLLTDQIEGYNLCKAALEECRKRHEQRRAEPERLTLGKKKLQKSGMIPR